jgi:hypothetical protein
MCMTFYRPGQIRWRITRPIFLSPGRRRNVALARYCGRGGTRDTVNSVIRRMIQHVVSPSPSHRIPSTRQTTMSRQSVIADVQRMIAVPVCIIDIVAEWPVGRGCRGGIGVGRGVEGNGGGATEVREG